MNLAAPNAYPEVGGRLAQFYCSWINFKTTFEDHMLPLYAVLICITMILKP